MMRTRLFIIFTALAIILGFGVQPACNLQSSKQSDKDEKAAPVKTKQGPGFLGAIKEMSKTAKKLEKMKERKPIKPVHFRELMAVLPEAPGGWVKLDDTDAKTATYGEWQSSYVSQSYQSKDKTQTVKVKVTDGAYIPYLYAAYSFASFVSEESLDHYKKGIELDHAKGWEEYYSKTKRGNLNLMQDERFLLEISGRGITDTKPLYAIYNQLDRKKLAAWAVEGLKESSGDTSSRK